MYYDLNEYDPFEPLFLIDWDGSPLYDDAPMNEDDWEEWLDLNN